MTKNQNLERYPGITLTISKFMSTFYGVGCKELEKLSHKTLKKIFPNLKSVPNNIITDENLITGDIILVIDCDNNIVGYSNPFINNCFCRYDNEFGNNKNIELLFTVDDDIDELKKLNEEDLEHLNRYELEKLLKLCMANQECKARRLVQRALYFNKENHSTKKEKLEKIRIKEFRKEDL